MNNTNMRGTKLVSDAEIVAAFKNTNFGSDNHRELLVEGVQKTAACWHNGWTMTNIIRELELGKPDPDDPAGNKLTQNGLDFIIQSAIANMQKTIEQKDALIEQMRTELLQVRHSLQFANESPGGGITDTLWMMHSPETVFDAIDGILALSPVSEKAK